MTPYTLALLVVMALVGCSPKPESPHIDLSDRLAGGAFWDVRSVHDSKNAVTCWLAHEYGHGISIHCIPDSQLAQVAR